MSETYSFDLPAFMREQFETALEKLNRKLGKIRGAHEATIVEEVPSVRLHPFANDFYGNPLKVDFLRINVSVPVDVKKKGFEYLGTISAKDGIKTIFTADPKTNLAHIDHFHCDHCGHARRRNVAHVFNRKGKEFVIGSKCVENYFGIEVFKALEIFKGFIQKFASEYDEDEIYRGGRSYGYDSHSVMAGSLIAHAENSRYVKAGYDSYDRPSKAVVEALISKSPIGMHKDEADKIEKLLKDYYGALDPKASTFNSNIVNALFHGGELRGYVPFKVVGLWVWAIFNALNKEAKKAEQSTKVNAHIGNVGEKISFSGVVKSIKGMGSFSYYGPASELYTVETAEGTVKFFSTKNFGAVGDSVSLIGKVKKHEDWKGYLSTMVSYVKEAPTAEDLKAEEDAKAKAKEATKVRAKVKKQLSMNKSLEHGESREVRLDNGNTFVVESHEYENSFGDSILKAYFLDEDGKKLPSTLTNVSGFYKFYKNDSALSAKILAKEWKKFATKVVRQISDYSMDYLA